MGPQELLVWWRLRRGRGQKGAARRGAGRGGGEEDRVEVLVRVGAAAASGVMAAVFSPLIRPCLERVELRQCAGANNRYD